jgi:hypothetical protein
MSSDLKVVLSLVDDFTKKLTGIESSLGSFGSQIDNVNKIAMRFGLGFGGYLAGGQIIGGIEELIGVSKEYTKEHNQLREALGYTSIELNKQVEILGKKYVIDHREITGVQQQLSLYTQDEGAIKSLTDATVNYAKATGKPLSDAVNLVDRAIVSATGTIRGFPGHLDGAAESSERLASIVETLNSKMHGQAAAVADSMTMWDRLSLSISTFKETVAVGIFGKATERELQKYEAMKNIFEEWTQEEINASPGIRENHDAAIKWIEAYEAKMGSAKKAAEDLRKENFINQGAGSMESLIPGHAQQGSLKRDEAEAKRRADERKREQIREADEIARLGDSITDRLTERDVRESEKRQSEQLKREKSRREGQIEIDKEIDSFMEEGQKRQEIYDKRAEDEAVKHKEEMARTAVSLGEAYGSSIGQGIGKGEAGLKSTMKGVLNTTIDFLERQALAAIMTNTIRDFGFYGPPGLVVGAVEAAGVTAIAEAAKAGINSFSMGTPFAPRGFAYLHKDESLYLPTGAVVKTASETRQTINNNSGGHTFNIHITDMSGALVESITTQIRSGATGTDRLLRAIAARI